MCILAKKNLPYIKLLCAIINLLIIQLSVWPLLAANQPYYRQITEREGLFAREIYDIYMSSSGLLYLGTDKGLLSFNGSTFSTIPMKDNLALSVSSIQEDENGNIHCYNFSNQIFRLENDTLRPISLPDGLPGEENDLLIGYQFIDNTLWILSQKRLYKQNPGHRFEEVIRTDLSNERHKFTSLAYDSIARIFYLGIYYGILSFDLKSQKQHEYPSIPSPRNVHFANNELFFNTKGDLNETWSFSNFRKISEEVDPSIYFNSLAQTGDSLWICTNDGVHLYQSDSSRLTGHLFEGFRVSDVVRDSENNLWISTLDDGLIVIPHQKLQKAESTDEIRGLNPNFRHLVADSNGNIFAGTSYGQIVEFSPTGKVLFTYSTVRNLDIEYLHMDNDLIISSRGIFLKRNPTPVYETYLGKMLSPDSYGNYVFAGYSMAGIISQQKGKLPVNPGYLPANSITYYSFSQFPMQPIRTNRSASVYFDPVSLYYYVGYSDDLWVYRPNGASGPITTADGKPIIALDIEKDFKNRIWIASAQLGLVCITDGEISNIYPISVGFSGTQLRCALPDSSGIWVLNEKGIDYLDFETEKISNISFNNGFNDLNINDILLTPTHLWLAANQGLFFVPKQSLFEFHQPRFVIQPIQVNGQILNPSTQYNPDQNNWSFGLQSIYFKNMGNLQHEYRLLPMQTDWQIRPSVIDNVTYEALSPGAYIFEARTRSGHLISEIQKVEFCIELPFWRKPWFVFLEFILLLAALIGAYEAARSRTLRKQKVHEALAQSQLKALRAQMNPHFVFNVLTAVQGLIYSNQKNRAADYLSTFSDLIRRTLQLSDRQEVTIQQEIEAINLYVSLEKGRFEDQGIEYRIETPDETDLSEFMVPSLIIQPFVENAIKHGLIHKKGNKELHIKLIRVNSEYWCFEIHDNGIGRKAAGLINQNREKYSSFATNAINQRIELINKISKRPISKEIIDHIDDQNQPTGTTVKLFIPVTKFQNQQNP